MLEIGLNMAIPIPDLEIIGDGFFATLSFERKPFKCFVSWESIFALVELTSGQGVFWSDSMPETLRKNSESPLAERPRHLRLVK